MQVGRSNEGEGKMTSKTLKRKRRELYDSSNIEDYDWYMLILEGMAEILSRLEKLKDKKK